MSDAATQVPNKGGRPRKPVPKKVAARFQQEIYDGLARRAERDGLSINDGLQAASIAWGDFPNGKPKITTDKRAKPSTASQVKTSAPVPEKPGARLDKTSARRSGPKIAKGPVVRHEDEEAV